MTLPPLFWAITTVVLAPFIGSFLSVVAIRLPQGRPIAWDRSACDACGARLAPLELIPIVSFVALRGRCGRCEAPIDRRHIGFELAAVAIGVWAALATPGPTGLVTALLGWQLLLLAALDAEHLWLPRAITVPLAVTGLLEGAALGWTTAMSRLIGFAIGFGALRLLAWAFRRLRGKEGLGGGDAWLLGAGGAWLGWTGLPFVLLIASLAGLLFALLPLMRGRRIEQDRLLPFGVFLALGIWLVRLYPPL